jgi:hypothetical protein
MAYEQSDQAKQEVEEIMGDLLANGLPRGTKIVLDDVRRLMILCWDRGYTACLEKLNRETH